ncbi:MAG: hypothetical protein ABI760_16900 [Ferruginibacter sp.]
MKKIITYSILVAFTLLSACRKSDNPQIPTLVRVPVPSLAKDASGTGTIIVSDLANFIGKVNVDVFFKSDILPKKMDLVMTKNGDKSIVKLIQADITAFPTVVSFTGPQLTTLFGSVQTCDFFEVGVNITTQDGTVYEAFPAVGIAYGAGVSGEYGGVQTTLNYSTKVEYDPNIYKGNFIPVSDEFADFTPADITLLTQIDDTHFSFKSPQAFNALPIIVEVDPATLKVSIKKQKIGDYFLWEHSYTNPNVATVASNPANKVIPCSQTLSVSLDYTVDQGGFGEYILILKKQ